MGTVGSYILEVVYGQESDNRSDPTCKASSNISTPQPKTKGQLSQLVVTMGGITRTNRNDLNNSKGNNQISNHRTATALRIWGS